MMVQSAAPTRFTGTFGEIFTLFLPIALMTFSGSLVLFVERLFFGSLSTEVMEAGISAVQVYYIVQAPCLVLAMMAQVYVGRLQGAQDLKAIGNTVWQFIWLSLISMCVIVPIGYLYGNYYFAGTAIEEVALPYFYFLLLINFLYPLGTSLSCFYIGRGWTKLCLFATMGAYFINLVLAYTLIMGIEGWVPSLGLTGAAISNLVAQGGFVLILGAVFLSSKHARLYGTHDWRFQPRLFWACIFPGLLRAANRLSVMLCYACIARLMIVKQGDYLLFWSVGSTIAFFLPFIGEAVCQALTTVISNIIGAKDMSLLRKVDFSGFLLVSLIALMMAIPMLQFPEMTFHFLFPEISVSDISVRRMLFGLWLSFLFATLAYVPVSSILAFKDTNFFLVTGSLSWINSFLTMHLAVNAFEVPADQCWTVLAFSNLVTLGLYLWRANALISQKKLCKNTT